MTGSVNTRETDRERARRVALQGIELLSTGRISLPVPRARPRAARGDGERVDRFLVDVYREAWDRG
jgi:hypothetical protein